MLRERRGAVGVEQLLGEGVGEVRQQAGAVRLRDRGEAGRHLADHRGTAGYIHRPGCRGNGRIQQQIRDLTHVDQREFLVVHHGRGLAGSKCVAERGHHRVVVRHPVLAEDVRHHHVDQLRPLAQDVRPAALRHPERRVPQRVDRVAVDHGNSPARARHRCHQLLGQPRVHPLNLRGVVRAVDPREVDDRVSLRQRRVHQRLVIELGLAYVNKIPTPPRPRRTSHVPGDEAVGPGDGDAGHASASRISGRFSSSAATCSTVSRSVLCEV